MDPKMASTSTAPSTPENKTRMQINRSFTLPPKFERSSSPAPEIGAAEGIETLFVHPNTTIVRFSTNSLVAGSTSARGLPWTSPTETTVAAGSLMIYRVPGSVAFLHSGTLLQTIMPRSQSWCVDGLSKFAMRVSPDTYYRIELPGQKKEELDLVEEFKAVLGRVMHYERTACPFKRDSEEELPELEDIRNRRLRPEDKDKWLFDRSRLRKTVTKQAMEPRQSSPLNLARKIGHIPEEASPGPAKSIERASAAMRSITAPPGLLVRSLDQSKQTTHESSSGSSLKPLQSIPTDMPPSPPDSSGGPEYRELDLDSALTRDVVSEAEDEDELDKSVLVHPVQALQIEEEDDLGDNSVLIHLAEVSTLEKDTKQDSSAFDTIDKQSDMTSASEHDLEEEATSRTIDEQHQGQMKKQAAQIEQDLTFERQVDQLQSKAEHESLTRTISNPDDPFAAIQARILARRSIGGTTSFYPSTVRESTSCSTSSVSSSSTISSRSQISQQRNLAGALVRKACAVFIGPPAHLVALMLRIAARFANGTFGSMFFVESPSGITRKIPGSFNINEDSHEGGLSDDEDDFGIPLHSPIRLVAAKSMRERKVRDRWEVD